MTVLSLMIPNSIKLWEGTDSAEQFKKNWESKQTRSKLIKNGYIAGAVIEYRTDHYGLRNKHNVDISNSMLALGCSFTFGTGLDITDTWVYRLGDKLGVSMYNAGIPGSSNDTAFRLANYLIPKYKPKAVFLLSTFEQRYEFYCDYKFYNYSSGRGNKIWITNDVKLSNELHDTLNTKKNILAIKCLCDEINIPFNRISVTDIIPVRSDRARDLEHWGRETQDNVADEMKNLLLDF